MTFEGKAKSCKSETSYIELIALYVHPKNSKHLRSHSRSQYICRLGLENKFSENKSGQIFLRSTGLLYKFLPTNLGVCKPTFYDSEVKQYYLSYRPQTECRISQFFKTNYTQ